MPDRITAILKMLEKSPGDVFLHYSLAKEHMAAGQSDEAVAEFRRCVELDPKYLPAYVECGKCLRAAGKPQEALAMFLDGKALAADKGERHVEDYIRQQLETLRPE